MCIASSAELDCTEWVLHQVTQWIEQVGSASSAEQDCTGCVLRQVTKWIVQSGYCAK